MSSVVLETANQDTVWALSSSGISAMPVQDLALKFENTVFYLQGTANNYGLIATLARQDLPAGRIQVGKPVYKHADPVKRLHCLTVFSVLQRRLGYWNSAAEQDRLHYQFLQENTAELFKQHCLYRAFQFLEFSQEDAHDFLSQVVDPRWWLSLNSHFRYIQFYTKFHLVYPACKLNPQTVLRRKATFKSASLFAPMSPMTIPKRMALRDWFNVLHARRLCRFLVEHWYLYLTGNNIVNLQDYFQGDSQLLENYKGSLRKIV